MESRRMRSRSQILKWVCYAVALFVCAALQTTPGLLQLGQAKPLFILPLCLAVAVYEGEFAGALFGAVSGLLWDYTAGRTTAMEDFPLTSGSTFCTVPTSRSGGNTPPRPVVIT